MLIYSKYSNERSRYFSIRTDIFEDNEERYVIKHAIHTEGQAHVNNIVRWYKELSDIYKDAPFEFNKCAKCEEGVRFEYVEGDTLENYLDELIKEGRTEEAVEKLCDYLNQLAEVHEKNEFSMTKEFIKVFGEHTFGENLKCAAVTNIDMVCGNYILASKPVVLDYEWTFDFPIPGLYVIYRTIHYYVESSPSRQGMDVDNLYKKYHITDDLQKIFKQMEISFQNYITGTHIPVRDLFAEMTPGVESNGVAGKSTLQIYFSKGDEYQEKNSLRFPISDGDVNLTIEVPAGYDQMRIDPGETACAVLIEKLTFNKRKVSLEKSIVTSGVMNGKWAYIPQNDPGIHDITIPSEGGKLKIVLKIYPGNIELIKRMCDVGRENQSLKNLIQDMRNTKVWKLYQAYRNKVERKKKA